MMIKLRFIWLPQMPRFLPSYSSSQVKYLKKHNPNDNEYLPTDLVATELNSGSEEYFDWVRQQVKKPDSETKEAERDANTL